LSIALFPAKRGVKTGPSPQTPDQKVRDNISNIPGFLGAGEDLFGINLLAGIPPQNTWAPLATN